MDFKTQTKWVVITGAPSSGKTSVIEELKARGYAVEPEAARAVIEDCLKRGNNIGDIRHDVTQLQGKILEWGLHRYKNLDPKQRTFLDRGLPDGVAYLKIAGLDYDAAMRAAYFYHYKAVFIFDRLPLVLDDIRHEDEEMAARIDAELEAVYRALGYHPVRIPVMSIADRADAILKHLEKAYQGSTLAHCR